MERAYIVPHPPIILPEVGRGEEEKIIKTIKAYRSVAEEIASIRPQTIIISSPHAPYYRDAFYLANAPAAKGNLKNFGIFNVEETVSVDQELSEEIFRLSKTVPLAYSPQKTAVLDHGSLIPLRFIKAVYPDFKVVLLGLSVLSAKDHYELGKIIQKATENLNLKCIYLASGDLSHVLKADGPYGYKKEGPLFDRKIVDILNRAAFDELLEISNREADAAAQCGLRSFQIMAGSLDGHKVETKKYSYEGPFGVGYAVFSFTPEEHATRNSFLTRQSKQGQDDPYIELAGLSLTSFIETGKIIALPADLPAEMLKKRAGCFVTLHKFNELRGCIGTISPTRSNIAEEIIRNAIAAATEDPRFPAVREDELNDITVSVDILERPEYISSLAELDPKVYGVIVSSGFRRGLLLPNLENVDSPEYQVEIALQKAGIRSDENFTMERFRVIRHEYKQ